MSAAAPEALCEAAGAALDLHEGIVDPLALGGCKRWPEHMRLLSSQGELVRGRCNATNLCRYCQTLYVVETVEMLTLDAMEHAPTLWGVLTAREHLTRADCRRHLERLRASLRKRWPDVEWFVQVEFQRRGALHLNLLFKGVPVEDVDELRSAVVELWCRRVDALPVGQWFDRIGDGVGVVKYLSKMLAHGLKAEQAPPIGWRGHRTSQTRGYLVRPAAAMRQEAREALRLKRALHRARKAGFEGEAAEAVAQRQLEVAAETSWRIVEVAPALVAQLDRVRTRPTSETSADVEDQEREHAAPAIGANPLPVAVAGGQSTPGEDARRTTRRTTHSPPAARGTARSAGARAPDGSARRSPGR